MSLDYEVIEISEDEMTIENVFVDCTVDEADESEGGVIIEEYEPIEEAEEAPSDIEVSQWVLPEVEEPDQYIRYYVYED